MLRLLEDKIATPLGPLWVIADEQFHLRAVEWEEHSDRMEELLNIHYRARVLSVSVPPIRWAERQAGGVLRGRSQHHQ